MHIAWDITVHRRFPADIRAVVRTLVLSRWHSKPSRNCHIDRLPIEMLVYILSFLSYPYQRPEQLLPPLRRVPSSKCTYKIAVLGSSAIGKSAFAIKFVTGSFQETVNPSCDTPHQRTAWTNPRRLLYKGTNVFTLPTSVSNASWITETV